MEEELYTDLKKLRIDPASPKNRSFPGKVAVLCGVMAIAGFAVFLLVRDFDDARKQVTVITVNGPPAGERAVLMTAGGYIVAESEVTVSSKVAGRIESLSVHEGDLVQKGEVIAVLDSEEFQVQEEEARANLEKAYLYLKHKQELHQKDVAEVKRRRELFREHLISPAELDKEEKTAVVSELELDSAQSEVEVCKKQLEHAHIRAAQSIIRAPITGTVIDKISDVGEMLFPMKTFEGISGSAVVTLADLNVMNVEVDINEDEINKIHIGNRALITPDSLPEKTYEGEVMAISPMADRQKNVVPVKVRIKNPDMYLRAGHERESGIPGKRIRHSAGSIRSYHTARCGDREGWEIPGFCYRKGICCGTGNSLGTMRGTRVTVEKGLTGGEQLVVEGHAHLRSHDKVICKQRAGVGI